MIVERTRFVLSARKNSQIWTLYQSLFILVQNVVILWISERSWRFDFGHARLFEIKAGKIIFVLVVIRRCVWPLFWSRKNSRFAKEGLPSSFLKSNKSVIIQNYIEKVFKKFRFSTTVWTLSTFCSYSLFHSFLFPPAIPKIWWLSYLSIHSVCPVYYFFYCAAVFLLL